VASDLSERGREREREFLDSTLPCLLGLCWKVLPQIERDGERERERDPERSWTQPSPVRVLLYGIATN